jgi:quinolinate synthase
MNLPMLGATDAPLMLENIPALQEEVRALKAERHAVILAHNYQLPEIQDVAPARSCSAACTSWPRPPRSCARKSVS